MSVFFYLQFHWDYYVENIKIVVIRKYIKILSGKDACYYTLKNKLVKTNKNNNIPQTEVTALLYSIIQNGHCKNEAISRRCARSCRKQWGGPPNRDLNFFFPAFCWEFVCSFVKIQDFKWLGVTICWSEVKWENSD